VSAVATPARQRASVERPSAPERSAQRLIEPRAGGASLEDRILAAWEDLAGAASAECPVCGGRMKRTTGCEECGSVLN
jgi:hypothetical protein